MRHTIHGSARGIDAVSVVIDDLSRPAHLSASADFFPQGRDVLVTRAPGTLRLFGGAADTAGARALHVATAEGTLVALQRDPQGLLTIIRRTPGYRGRADIFEMPMHFLLSDGRPVRYDVARHYFARHDDRAWAAPFAAAFLAMMRDRHVRFAEGVRVLIAAAAPRGHGRGADAAAVIALLRGLFAEMNLVADPRELTTLAAHADRGVHGPIDGIADHWPATSAESEHVLAFTCQPQPDLAQVPWPTHLAVFGLDVGASLGVDLADTRQHDVRVAMAMAARLLATQAPTAGATGGVPDAGWHGALANLGPEAFAASHRASLPETMRGRDFLDRAAPNDDEQRMVSPDTVYRVRAAASYGIYEHARARAFESFLPMPGDQETFDFLGDMLFEAHDSARACGLSFDAADAVVDGVRRVGRARGLLGARLGGGGTTVVILARADAREAVLEVQRTVGERLGAVPLLIEGWSMGAVPFGYVRLRTL